MGGAPSKVTYTALFKAAYTVIPTVMLVSSLIPAVASAGMVAHALSFFTGNLQARAQERSLDRSSLATMALPKAAMNIDPNPSKGGGDITIVDASAVLSSEGPSGTPAEIEENTNKNTNISLYIVREGDTLSGIAQAFDVSVNTIMWANDIKKGQAIQPGQQLVILPVTGIRYTVKSGGTIRDIIKKHGGDVEEAALYNGIDPDQELAAGTVVIVPDGVLAIPQPVKKTTSSVRGAAGVPNYSGYYLRPVTNGIKTQGIHGYNGVDLGSPVGTPVLASASGDVIISRASGWNGGYGSYIVIRHDNGTQTLYAHLSRTIVGAGEHVVQGQIIGYVGNTGRSTGPHLHFEIRGAKNPF